MTDSLKPLPYYVAEPGSGPEARSAFIHDEGRNVTIMVDARRRFQDPLPIAKAIVEALNGTPSPAREDLAKAAKTVFEGALPTYCGGERDKRVEVSVMLGAWLDLQSAIASPPPPSKSEAKNNLRPSQSETQSADDSVPIPPGQTVKSNAGVSHGVPAPCEFQKSEAEVRAEVWEQAAEVVCVAPSFNWARNKMRKRAKALRAGKREEGA